MLIRPEAIDTLDHVVLAAAVVVVLLPRRNALVPHIQKPRVIHREMGMCFYHRQISEGILLEQSFTWTFVMMEMTRAML